MPYISNHELSYDDRLVLSLTPQMYDFLNKLYRRRGKPSTVNARDDEEGIWNEFHDWFQALERIGMRLDQEALAEDEKLGRVSAGGRSGAIRPCSIRCLSEDIS